ncbi:hypothetical protein SASPL_124450 [Salvia splendens]|uniref:Uncharacterized protein n=1 Tax=Salvia splendens TaxID=180675 RepID=A0A8X8XQY8_SALSN|nr:hypothetical protein SASPL_124450 [Salvia splendens]
MHHCLYDVTGSDVTALQLRTMIRLKLITVLEQEQDLTGQRPGKVRRGAPLLLRPVRRAGRRTRGGEPGAPHGRAAAARLVSAGLPGREPGHPGEPPARDVPVAGVHHDGGEWVLEARVEGFVIVDGVRMAAVRLARSRLDGCDWVWM